MNVLIVWHIRKKTRRNFFVHDDDLHGRIWVASQKSLFPFLVFVCDHEHVCICRYRHTYSKHFPVILSMSQAYNAWNLHVDKRAYITICQVWIIFKSRKHWHHNNNTTTSPCLQANSRRLMEIQHCLPQTLNNMSVVG